LHSVELGKFNAPYLASNQRGFNGQAEYSSFNPCENNLPAPTHITVEAQCTYRLDSFFTIRLPFFVEVDLSSQSTAPAGCFPLGFDMADDNRHMPNRNIPRLSWR